MMIVVVVVDVYAGVVVTPIYTSSHSTPSSLFLSLLSLFFYFSVGFLQLLFISLIFAR